MSVLHIYKSSAGSGKTYNLTKNYLQLLFDRNISHRNILAVTFTNKASAEMKSRIIETLNLLSKGDEVSSSLAAEIFNGKDYDEKEIFNQASDLLTAILNDYSAFYVSTIDRFFQWIIRNFAKESGLQAGYNLELNNRLILAEAVDLMMFSLDTDENLKNWLLKYAGEKISSGKDWNFTNDILTLGAEIFKEQYQEITGGIKAAREQKDKIEKYRDLLFNETNKFENYLAAIGNEVLDSIKNSGLSADDFAFKEKGIVGYFTRMAAKKDFDPKARAREAVDQPDKWVTSQQDRKDEVLALVNRHLNSLLNKAIAYYDEQIIHYNTANTILRNLFSFGILTDIYLNVREITAGKNLFLLSDATVFLKRIIANNEAPFIYEKAGNSFHHFMLDEFQDTSRYQWHNFFPLIINGLATDHQSLIVGDVKQAIYRWRNSDWRILASEVGDSFSRFDVRNHSLDTNWRSNKNIVAFNNSLFYFSPDVIMEKIRHETANRSIEEQFISGWEKIIQEIYKNSLQKVSPKKPGSGGYVEVSFFSMKKDEYREMLSQQLPTLILEILSRGYNQGDITILVRKGTQGRDIANILMNYTMENPEKERFNIISNDSLYIENHSSVQFLTALLRYFKNPSDLLNIAFIRHEFIRYLSCNGISEDIPEGIFDNCGNGITSGMHKVLDTFAENIEFLKRLPLFELTEEFIRLFELNKSTTNIAFIQAFQDLVLEFVRTQPADISSFLSWWELNGANQTLTVSETQDAIKIMTIHKSKGLQFPIVIIPICEWNMDAENKRDNFIWCKNNYPPFDFIENVPVNYSKGLVDTYFQHDYFDEKFRNYVDSLNLLYVSFTRPEDELYIFSNTDKKDTTAELLNKIISNDTLPPPESNGYPLINLNAFFRKDQNTFALGEKVNVMMKKEKAFPEFMQEYQVSQERDRYRLNIKNSWLLRNEYDFSGKIGYGTVMHEILSEINTSADIDMAVGKAALQGKIPDNEQTHIIALLKRKINTPQVSVWFDGSWKLMREREIGGMGKRIYRPDRVMIREEEVVLVDFKFGDEVIKNHELQVQKYVEEIKNMKYREVTGYLWYFSTGNIIKV